MTHDQHKAIIAFIRAATGGEQPPMDVEADAIIRALFVRNPDAAYRVTMLAMSLLANSEPQRPQNLPRHRGWFSTLFDKRSGASHAPSERREPVIS